MLLFGDYFQLFRKSKSFSAVYRVAETEEVHLGTFVSICFLFDKIF